MQITKSNLRSVPARIWHMENIYSYCTCEYWCIYSRLTKRRKRSTRR